MPLPPWLDTGPKDFLQATEAGASQGLDSGIRAGGIAAKSQEAANRLQAESQTADQRAAIEQQQLQQRITQEQAQLGQQAQIVQMEMQTRQEIAKQNNARMQTQLAIANAYKQAQLGLGQQRISQMEAVAQQKAQDAALSYRDEQGFMDELNKGTPIEQALFKYPRTRASLVTAFTHTGTASSKPEEDAKRMALQHAYRTQEEAAKSIRDFQSKTMGSIPLPKELQQSYDQATAEIGQLTGKPALQPPPAGPQQSPKVALANKLLQEHPDWSKKQVVDAVNQQLSQPQPAQ